MTTDAPTAPAPGTGGSPAAMVPQLPGSTDHRAGHPRATTSAGLPTVATRLDTHRPSAREAAGEGIAP
jgi:hypothetical protein